MHPHDVEPIWEKCQVNLTVRKACDNEYRIFHRNGEMRWVRDQAQGIYADTGELIFIEGLITDITARKQAEENLRASEEKLRALFDTLSEGVALNEIIYDENGEMVDYRILEVNKAFYATADYSASQVVGNVATKLYGMSPELIKSFWEGHKNVSGTIYTDFYSPLNNKYYFIATSPFTNDKFVTSFLDITERKQMEEALARERDLLEALLANIPDTIYFKDTASRFTRINRARLEVLGVDNPQDAVGKTDFDFQPQDLAEGFYAEEQRIVETGEPVINRIEYNPTVDGKPRWFSATKVPLKNEEGQVTSIVGVSRNITEQMQIEESLRATQSQLQAQLAEIEELHIELREQAIRDPLTGLYNRRYLFEALAREVPRAIRAGYPVSIIMLDIDLFKIINDTFGHDAGDKGLQVLAAQLQASARAEDIVCRYGGDEHLIVMHNTTGAKAAERAEQLRKAIAKKRVSYSGKSFQFTCSFGVAVFPIHAPVIEDVISVADRALYQSKELGRNRVTLL